MNRQHSQVELLVPHRVEVSEDGLRPALGLAHLDGDVRVAGARFVLGLQTLRAHDCRQRHEKQRVTNHKPLAFAI